MTFRDSAARFIATGFSIGNIPFAPGTFGTLLGLPLCLALSFADFRIALVGCVLLVIIAIWAAHATEKMLDRKDPGCIVIDEVAGMVVTLAGLPFTVKTAVIGFIVFRFLDIVKPPPVRYIDERLSGGTGVVLDDVAAGILGNLILRFLFAITGV